MLNKNTLGVKKVRGQSEAAFQIGTYVRPKTLISVEAKKLLIKNLFHTIIINKGGQVTKPIIVVKICYKLLYIIQVVKKIFDK